MCHGKNVMSWREAPVENRYESSHLTSHLPNREE